MTFKVKDGISVAGSTFVDGSRNTTTNDLTVGGNLTVSGTTTTINTATLEVADLNITVAKNAATAAAANGAGLTVAGAAATLLYTSAADSWNFNKNLFASNLSGTNTGDNPGVTSVATSGTVSGLTLTGGTITTTGTITLGGTLSVLPSNFASQSATTVLAAPTLTAGVPTFRILSLEDIPDAWIKKSVTAATTANITLSAPQTIDGIAVVAGNRVLVKDQTTASTNGIYVVAAAAWTRALDADTSSEIAGAHVNVDSGTANGGLSFDTDFKTTDVLGTTSLLWNRNIDAGYVIPITQGGTGAITAALARTALGAGTVTSVAALTLGTTGTDITSTVATGTTAAAITLNVPTASATNRGALSAADWTTFNNKQATGLSLLLTGGTMTGVITGRASAAVAAITSVTAGNSAYSISETGNAVGFIPGYGQTSTITAGYRSHMVLGSYRTGNTWGGGPFISWGGSDNNSTENWLFNTGGSITHSSGSTFVSSANVSTYAVTSITATTPIVTSASVGSITLSHAASGATTGTYNNVTVNATGHVTAGSNVAYYHSGNVPPYPAEADTLATVTGRGATTTTAVILNGGLSTGTASTGVTRAIVNTDGDFLSFYSTESNARVKLGRDVGIAGGAGLALGGALYALIASSDTNGSALYFKLNTAAGAASTSPNMALTTTGLGINTLAPATKLHITATSATSSQDLITLDGGSAGFSGTNDVGTGYSIIFNGCAYNGSIVQRTGAAIQMLKSNSWNESGGGGTKASLVFKTNNGTVTTPDLTERMRLDASGNLGIGISAPAAKLHVYNRADAGAAPSTPEIRIEHQDINAVGTGGSHGGLLSFYNIQQNNTGWAADAVWGKINFWSSQPSSGVAELKASIWASSDGAIGGTTKNTYIAFATSAGTAVPAERMRITANGGIAFNGAANYGSSGQVLQSNGDASPTWVAHVTSVVATTPIVTSAATGAITLSHATSGATAGTYNNVTVNVTGHVTAGSNVAYLTGYTETDTLATVTARGATTATSVSLTNTVNYAGGIQGINDTALTISAGSQTQTNVSGKDITIRSGNGGPAGVITAGGAAGAAYITGGTGTGAGWGGSVYITGGVPAVGGTGSGAAVFIKGGNSTATSTLAANSGMVEIFGGDTATSQTRGGNVYIKSGLGKGTTTYSSVYIQTAIGGTSDTTQTFNAFTAAFSQGSTTLYNNVSLPNVGTSGFVKLGAGGLLSADTTTYVSTSASQSANTVLASPNNAAGAPTFRNLTLEDLPDAWVKKSVRAATTADLAASTWSTTSSGILTGYANTQTLALTTTAASTTVTTTSTAGLKVGAVVSTATAAIAAGTTVATIASATTFTVTNRANITTATITGTGGTATATFAAQTYAPYAVGSVITITGATPATYNGSFTVTACTTTTVSWASAEITTATVQGTIAFTIAAGSAVSTIFAQTIAALVIDGITLAANDRLLVKNQSTLGGIADATNAKNGIYVVTAIGSTSVAWVLTRAADASIVSELAGAMVAVDSGTINGGLSFDCDFKSTDTLNTTGILWYRSIDSAYFTTVGNNFATLTNPSAITFPRINADNTVSTLAAAAFRTAIGAGVGTVTGVTATAPVVSSGGTAPVISMAAATTSVAGYLTAADWTTFNNKQATGTCLLLTGGTLTGRLVSRQSGVSLGTGNSSQLEINNAASGACNISFHREGAYGAHFGLDTDNWFSTYGWSAGTGYTSMRVGELLASGNVTAYSDERLKKDWAKLPVNFIEQLSKVKSGTYTRIDNDTRQAGSSAQDWQALLPEVVVVSPDESKTLSLAYGNAALVSAIELAKEVVTLNERIARLEALVSKLIEG